MTQEVTEWLYEWKENGWKTAGGDDVKNKDIWMELANLAEDSTTKISWKHVVVHSRITGRVGRSIVQPINSSGKMPENSGMANTPKITEVANTGICE